MNHDLILRIATKALVPFIMLFALYVHFHGDYGPGGGFQGGVIAAGMVILYAIVFGVDAAERAVPQKLVAVMIPIGVLFYGITGLISLMYGVNYLDYSILGVTSKQGHHLGILLVESAVLITVAGTMTAIFYAFVKRGR